MPNTLWPMPNAGRSAGRTRVFVEEAVLKLNGMLPPDVGIAAIHTVGEKAHARFDAVERGYTYLIHNAKDPFLEGRSTRVYGDLDVAAMQEASAHLVRKDDFASFCKAGSDQGTTICDVREARWEVLGPHRWAFHITADVSCATWSGPRWARSSKWARGSGALRTSSRCLPPRTEVQLARVCLVVGCT